MGHKFDILNSSKNRVILRHKASRTVFLIERSSLTEFTVKECIYESVYKYHCEDLGTYGSQIEAAMSLSSIAVQLETQKAAA